MKVSIQTYYRVVKVIRNNETHFVPQYQEEGDPETTFHNFRKVSNGRTGGYDCYFFVTEEDAIDFIHHRMEFGDEVVWGRAAEE